MAKFSSAQIEAYEHMDKAVRALWQSHIDEGFDPQAGAHALSLLAMNALMHFYEADHIRGIIDQQLHLIEAGMSGGAPNVQ